MTTLMHRQKLTKVSKETQHSQYLLDPNCLVRACGEGGEQVQLTDEEKAQIEAAKVGRAITLKNYVCYFKAAYK